MVEKKWLGKYVYNILENVNLDMCFCLYVFVTLCERGRECMCVCFLWYMGILTVRLKIHRVFYRDALVHRAAFPFRVPMHLSSICNVYFPRPDHRVQLQQPYSLSINDSSPPHPLVSFILFVSFSTISLFFSLFALICWFPIDLL